MAQGGNRQKRKRKQRSRNQEVAPGPAPAPAEPAVTRSEAKNAAVRAELQPLGTGERPGAVTIGALVALVFALANIISYAAGVKVNGDRPAITGILLYTGLMLVVAWGMWHSRYWAVLGMETLLALILLLFAVLLVKAGSIGTLVICLAVIALAGTLFWFLIRAMARIQMPKPPGADKR